MAKPSSDAKGCCRGQNREILALILRRSNCEVSSHAVRLLWPDFSNFVLHRLLPAALTVLLADAAIYQYLSFGPLWDREKSFLNGNNCKNYWWANLLFINNFFNTDYQVSVINVCSKANFNFFPMFLV